MRDKNEPRMKRGEQKDRLSAALSNWASMPLLKL